MKSLTAGEEELKRLASLSSPAKEAGQALRSVQRFNDSSLPD
jgi:hypothetical protein